MAVKKKTLAKKAGTSMSAAAIKKQMEQDSASIADQISAPSGNKIKTKNKQFTFPSGEVEAGPVDLVVIDFNSKNALYEGKFDEKNPAPPVCFALGKTIKDMKPSPNAPDPQCDNCAECPNNQFGSDGDGKACKNSRVLVVLGPEDVDPEIELMTLEVSATAIKRFDAFVSTAQKVHGLPPYGVIVSAGFVDELSYPSLTFSDIQENKNVAAHIARRAEAADMLEIEPDLSKAKVEKKKSTGTRTRRS